MSGFTGHPQSAEEIDLLRLARTLWQGRRTIIIAVLFGMTVTGLVAYFGSWTWTSEAVLVAPSLTDNPDLVLERTSLKTLGITPEVTDGWLSGRFIRTFSARDTKLDFLRTSRVFQDMTAGLSASARIAAENAMMKGMVLEASPEGRGEKTLYPYLTALLKAKDPRQAQQLLDDWITYVNDRVATMARQTLEEQRRVHLEAMRQQLDLARSREAITREVAVTRLGYALSLAKAAGVSQPVFMKGEAFHDDPDFPLGLGEKGLSRKLAIFSGETDLRVLSVSLQEKEDMLSRLEKLPMTASAIQAVHLLSRPELPERHDGPGLALLLVLGALLGGLTAAGWVFLLNISRPQNIFPLSGALPPETAGVTSGRHVQAQSAAQGIPGATSR
ncbi:Wzz/FepE/Etk N-terminal domain-containing protein [Enterobacter asburiae]|uniref:Wzz/FepE/Etk N-terminal domain-containing protein n=1 Tax=Enterobacter asburiae TaxID=61645 RepID=UPI003BE8B3B1